MTISFDHTTHGQRVLFGTGTAVTNTVEAVEGLGAKRVLLIADAFASALSDAIAERTPVVARVHEIVQHVPIENATRTAALARKQGADAVITIGGGSSIGLAKIVARDAGLPIIAVPTTFAGSEATNVWGITEAGRKTTGVDDKVLPKVIVYDASLMASLPGRLAVSSGLNAVAHAVDGFWAPRNDPINKAMGTEGLRALFPGLRALHADPDDIGAREKTLYGAYLAAISFASAGSGMHHKICHALGGTYNMPHAETHSVVIGYVTAFNAPYAADAAERVAAAIGDGRSAAAGIYALREEVEAPMSLKELGFKEQDVPEAAGIILPAIPPSNPRQVNRAALETLLRAAWAGDPIE
ncbi:maleylacetate reductase [Streptomyces sp. PSKA54]|uniref:Maleylacetate reductase n=1 Tax=Streptomyces himalayensis subsp. aureolus TaxID=2758039 RepID=A0A7W2HIU3_9ACTN|nr:maleylacetate reductase [Streptomyces himalayensis]MBA4865184.1 maleylacetate reductase [Streptomyces himalayensis subsp. aureolus]